MTDKDKEWAGIYHGLVFPKSISELQDEDDDADTK